MGSYMYFVVFLQKNSDIHLHNARQKCHCHMSLCRNNLGTCGLRYTGASVWNNILSIDINPNVSEFILFSRVCAHSTSRTRFSSIHVVCMAPIQPAVPSSLPFMLCVWPPFNQPHLPLFHPCCVYGPHSTSRAFLSSIHVVCMAPIQLAVPSSLSSMLCVWPPFN